MPNKGDSLYRVTCDTLELEKVTFLEESIAEGATIPTWVVRSQRVRNQTGFPQRVRCSVGSYDVSPTIAWAKALKAHEEGIVNIVKQQQELQEHANRVRQEIIMLKERVQQSMA